MSLHQTLSDKVAIVFGGSRGIGAAIARRLATDGADVALTYVSSAEKAMAVAASIESAGRKALALQADSADSSAIQGAVKKAMSYFGKIDIAVINAGVLPLGTIDQVKLAELDHGLNINLRGAFLAVQACSLVLSDGGRIITIGSNTANKAFPGSSVYSMTKAALAMLVKCVALELAPRKITVNNVQPGPTLTDMSAAHADHLAPSIPLQRVASPDEIAGLVAYLGRQESGYMTGASLTIDGGLSL